MAVFKFISPAALQRDAEPYKVRGKRTPTNMHARAAMRRWQMANGDGGEAGGGGRPVPLCVPRTGLARPPTHCPIYCLPQRVLAVLLRQSCVSFAVSNPYLSLADPVG